LPQIDGKELEKLLVFPALCSDHPQTRHSDIELAYLTIEILVRTSLWKDGSQVRFTEL